MDFQLTLNPFLFLKKTLQSLNLEKSILVNRGFSKKKIKSKMKYIWNTSTQLEYQSNMMVSFMNFKTASMISDCTMYSEPSLQRQHFFPKDVAIKMNLLL